MRAASGSRKKTILLLRHGATPPNTQHRFIGSTDISLSRVGRQQLKVVAAQLGTYGLTRCFCSPMRRCRQTADIVLADADVRAEMLPELREIDFGSWEGLTFGEVPSAARKGIERWAKFDPDFCFPGGERLGDFTARVKRAARQISFVAEDKVIVITHGGVIRLLTCHFLGLPMRKYLLFEPQPASITIINLFGAGKGTLAALIPCGNVEEN